MSGCCDKIIPVLEGIIEQLEGMTNGANFIYVQVIPTPVWFIEHNLNSVLPTVVLVDDNDEEINGLINYIDNNTLTISFNADVSGRARITK
jgi:hypothetical protein